MAHSKKTAEALFEGAEQDYRDARDKFLLRRPRIALNRMLYRGAGPGKVNDIGQWEDAESEEETDRPTPYVRAFVSSAVSSLLQSMINPEVASVESDPLSRVRAQANHQLARSFLAGGRVIRFEDLHRALHAAQNDGAVWFKTYWDPMAGDRKRTPRIETDEITGEQQYATDEYGVPLYDVKFQGEVVMDWEDVYDVLPDPHARREFDHRYIIHRKWVTVRELEDRFPRDAYGHPTKGLFGTKVEHEDDRYRADIDEQKATHYTNPGNEIVEMVEAWYKPSNEAEDGTLIVWAGDVHIAAGGLPGGRWPWRMLLGPSMVPNAIYADGKPYDLSGLQASLNETSEQLADWVWDILNPQILSPREAMLAKGAFSNKMGNVILYNGGFKPEYANPPSPPNALFTQLTTLVDMMRDVTGDAGLNAGRVPTGVDSGRAMAFLDQFMNARTAPEQYKFKLAMIDVLTVALEVARDHYDDERVVWLLGPDDAWMGKFWRAQDYDIQIRVVIEPFGQQPESKAVRDSRIMEAFEKGVFGVPADPATGKIVRRLMAFNVPGASIDPYEAHRQRAQRELLEWLSEGKPMEVRIADNDDAHLDEHDLVRISPSWDLMTPEQQQELDLHCEWHAYKRDMALGGMADEASRLGPGGGGPPKQLGPGGGTSSPADGGASPMADTPTEDPAEVAARTAPVPPTGGGIGAMV